MDSQVTGLRDVAIISLLLRFIYTGKCNLKSLPLDLRKDKATKVKTESGTEAPMKGDKDGDTKMKEEKDKASEIDKGSKDKDKESKGPSPAPSPSPSADALLMEFRKQLMVAAHRLQLQSLVNLCGRAMVSKINESNTAELLELADNCNCNDLKVCLHALRLRDLISLRAGRGCSHDCCGRQAAGLGAAEARAQALAHSTGMLCLLAAAHVVDLAGCYAVR